MFSYYGSKSRIIDRYPPPKYGKIIEPFAGSARYALKYWDREVLIVDKWEDLILVWNWLKECSKKDILSLPKLTKGLDIRILNLSKAEKTFLSFLAASGRPSNIVTAFMDHDNSNQNRYKIISEKLHRIRHWEIRHGCYTDLKNDTATWFIDPPYQFGGEHYKESGKNLNFNSLSDWCKSRNGQVIVCENTKANWMDFKPMRKIQGANNTGTTEAIWSNLPTAFDNQQGQLFNDQSIQQPKQEKLFV